MTTARTRGRTFSTIGIGVVACAACCAGPVIAILGGITIAGIAGTVASAPARSSPPSSWPRSW